MDAEVSFLVESGLDEVKELVDGAGGSTIGTDAIWMSSSLEVCCTRRTIESAGPL